MGDWYALILKYLDDTNKRRKNEKNEYWRIVHGYPNPYGKEFYDYVKAHDFIKFSSDPEIARKEMMEIYYKMRADSLHEDMRTIPCEKSAGRLLLELFLDILDNSI